MSTIHSTAQISPKAKIGNDVEIGAFAIITDNVVIGDRCKIMNNCTVMGHTVMGDENTVFPYAVIGGDPQDLKYKGEETRLIIGNKNTFREYVTVNRGTTIDTGETVLGDNNYLMASSHVAHDCILNNNVVLANGTLLGGHVTLEDNVTVSGFVGIHHFVTVGKEAFIGGMSRIQSDVPPFMTIQGTPARARFVNAVGLKRHHISDESIEALKKAYKIVWRSGCTRTESCEMLESTLGDFEEIQYLVQFLRAMEKGPQGRAREAARNW